MYSQSSLTTAVKEAKSINKMLHTNQSKLKILYENLEQKTVGKFLPQSLIKANEDDLTNFNS